MIFMLKLPFMINYKKQIKKIGIAILNIIKQRKKLAIINIVD